MNSFRRSPSFLMIFLLCCFFVLSVSGGNSVSKSRQLIDNVCKSVKNPRFCRDTLIPYQPARVSRNATALAAAVIKIGRSFADETRRFVEDAIKKDPTIGKTFREYADAYVYIVSEFEDAAVDLWGEFMVSDYDILLTRDKTQIVMETLLRQAKDPSSKTLIWKTKRMNAYIELALAATNAALESRKTKS